MKLFEYREYQNKSQDECAKELNISRQYYNEIETGRREPGKKLIKDIIVWSGGLIKLTDLWVMK